MKQGQLQLTDVFALTKRTRRSSAITTFVGGTDYGIRSGFRGIGADGPVQLQIQQGKRLEDLLFVDGSALVVSKKIVELWEGNSFRGWRKVPVVILDLNGAPISEQYFSVMITGRAGP